MQNNIMSHAQEEPAPNTQKYLHQGYVELYHHGLFHIKSTALLCAVGLGIPSAIHRRGGAATASDLVAETGVHPAKLPYLRRLMSALAASGVFAAAATAHQPDDGDDDGGDTVYMLTPVSRILVAGDGGAPTPRDMSALLRLLARPSTAVSPFFSLETLVVTPSQIIWCKRRGYFLSILDVKARF